MVVAAAGAAPFPLTIRVLLGQPARRSWGLSAPPSPRKPEPGRTFVRIFPEEKPTTIANPELQTGYYFNLPKTVLLHIEKRNHIGTNFI